MPIDVQKRLAIAGIFTVICFSTTFLTTYSAVASRARQVAVMRGLGGSRLFIVRTILAEFALLTVGAVGAGLGISTAGLHILRRIDVNIRIAHSAMLIVPVIAAVFGIGGALCRTLQIVKKFATYLKTGPR